MSDLSWGVPDVEPDAETGLSIWPCFANKEHVGRIEETSTGYVPIEENKFGADVWRGAECPFREQAIDALKEKVEAARGCVAAAALDSAEIHRLNDLPDAEFDVEAGILECDFQPHGPEVMHYSHVQSQTSGSDELTTWWLRWDDSGSRELHSEPSCGKYLDDDEDGLPCLLVARHPGACDNGEEDVEPEAPWTLQLTADDGLAAWELRHGGEFEALNEDLGVNDLIKAKAWAAGEMDFSPSWTVNPFTRAGAIGTWTAPGVSATEG